MIHVNPEAKLRVDMDRQKDKTMKDYFIGMLQFGGTLNFERGQSFMLFTSDAGKEEIQIAPIDESKRMQRKRNGIRAKMGKVCIDLHPFTDNNGDKVFVGEVICPTSIDCTEGIFLTAFTSREGEEELQLSRLDHTRRRSSSSKSDKDFQAVRPSEENGQRASGGGFYDEP